MLNNIDFDLKNNLRHFMLKLGFLTENKSFFFFQIPKGILFLLTIIFNVGPKPGRHILHSRPQNNH